MQLVLSFVLLALLPLVAVSALATYRTERSLQEKAGVYLQRQAQETADKVDRNLFERYGDVQAIALNPAARGSRSDVSLVADTYARTYGFYDLIVVADLTGRIVGTNTRSGDGRRVDTDFLLGQDVRNRDWFRAVAGTNLPRGTTHLLDARVDDLAQNALGRRDLTLQFSGSVRDERGRLVRVLSLWASFPRVVGALMADQRDALRRQGVRTVESQVMDARGLLLDDADPTAIGRVNLAAGGLEAARRGVRGESGYTVENHLRRGNRQVNGFAPSQGYLAYRGHSWIILVRQDFREASATATSIRRFTILLAAVAALLVVVLALLFAAAISAPLQRAVGTLEDVSAIQGRIARGEPLVGTLTAVAVATQARLAGSVVQVLLPGGREGTEVYDSGGPAAGDLATILGGVPFGALPFPCSSVAGGGVVAVELQGGSWWARHRGVLAAAELTSCWVLPVRSRADDQVVGILAAYVRTRRHPDEEQRALLDRAELLVSVAVAREQSYLALHHAARHDALTGLPNRAELHDRLIELLSRPDRGPVAVLFCDLDQFKVVNDTMGHGIGDELLITVAGRLSGCLGSGQGATRFGGDEFVVLCEQLDGPEAATALAERIGHAVRQPMQLGGGTRSVSASIGIAWVRTGGASAPGDEADLLLRDADMAMYEAKRRGRDRCVLFDDTLRELVLRGLRISDDLRQGLAREEVFLAYQPIVNVRTGAVVGLEALARWEHPTLGRVPPEEFVAVAETDGSIGELGAYVLDRACRQLAAWRAEVRDLPPLTMAVNVSARQLTDPALPEQVQAVLDRTGLAPLDLCLEITETALMDDGPAVLAALLELTRLGVTLAIDDFGTGYASLSYLKRYPVRHLKVDRSFIEGLGEDPGDTAIVTGVVGMARALGLGCVAEGVETAAQLEMLRGLGCDRAQGYHLSRPGNPQDTLRRILAGPTVGAADGAGGGPQERPGVAELAPGATSGPVLAGL